MKPKNSHLHEHQYGLNVTLTHHCKLITQLQRFAPTTSCVGHVWVGCDLEDNAPDLTPHEVLATLALADATLAADISFSWYFLLHCAETILAKR